jgi:pyruvate/2-oxoglutarate/acetoin dehydrogenase E1 component
MKKYWQTVNDAVKQEMRRDASVCYFGQDVAAPGGPFGATRGLLEEFGDLRVRDTPISEGALVGAAAGAAMAGLRPIVEIMFSDFLMLAADQLVNNAAKIRFMSGGQFTAPLVVRSMCGIGRQSGAQHTQSIDGWFASVPGLVVVRPSTPADAAGLLKSAVRDDGPVLFIDDLALWGAREDVPDDVEPIPLGQAFVRRSGTDATVVSWASGVPTAMRAADALAEGGISAEVVDLRTLSPLDVATVTESVQRTGALVVVENSVESFGPGSHIISSIVCNWRGPGPLPVQQLAARPAPTPYSRPLLDVYYPSSDAVADAVRSVVIRKAGADVR